RFLLFIVALGSQPSSVTAIAAEGVVLMQSRLRGSKTTETSGETSITFEDADTSRESSLEEALGARYSDDDESCSAEGLSPGVCALSSLARPRVVKTRLRKSVADCDEEESRARLERALVAEIESALAGNHSAFDDSRLQKLEEDLRPLYATLPHEYPLADIE
ncbi:licD, partial [Symbiodinium pilosum]